MLATGDSTMQSVDVALADELAGTADVVSDVHPGAGLSYDDGWEAVARRQAAARHAATVVLSLGADEGWPMTAADGLAHDCCDAAWVDEYARRMRRVLTTYRRHAAVIVLTVPAPRDPDRAAIVAASNSAIIRVAGAMPGVRLLRMDQLFTPDGYRRPSAMRAATCRSASPTACTSTSRARRSRPARPRRRSARPYADATIGTVPGVAPYGW